MRGLDEQHVDGDDALPGVAGCGPPAARGNDVRDSPFADTQLGNDWRVTLDQGHGPNSFHPRGQHDFGQAGLIVAGGGGERLLPCLGRGR